MRTKKNERIGEKYHGMRNKYYAALAMEKITPKSVDVFVYNRLFRIEFATTVTCSRIQHKLELYTVVCCSIVDCYVP